MSVADVDDGKLAKKGLRRDGRGLLRNSLALLAGGIGFGFFEIRSRIAHLITKVGARME